MQQIEQMPGNVNRIRQVAIDHLMDRVSAERQALMQDLTVKMGDRAAPFPG